MRTDILDVADILKSRDGVRARYELRLQSGGETVTNFTSTYRTVTDSPGIPTLPVPQDVALLDGVATSIMSHSGVIKLQDCFSAVVTTTIATDVYSRPSIRDYDETYAQIAYVSDSGSIYTAKFNKSDFLFAHVVNLTDTTEITGVEDRDAYALHLVANDELVIMYIKNGGIVSYSTLHDATSLPMYYPTYVYTSTDAAALNFTGACRFDGTLFAYFSMYDGSVQANRLIENGGIWSDMYEAVASDLSEFKISKASTYNGKVILSGQFNRVDPTGAFESPYIYGMVLSSSDGIIFAIDRHSLFSFGNEDDSDDGARRLFALGVDAPDYRYNMGGPAFVYFGGGTLAIGKCKYTVAPQQYTTTFLKLFGMSGSYNDGWSLKAGNMPLDQYENIKLGDAADIYMAVPDDTGAWGNWFMLQHGVITRKSQSIEDGKITTDLEFEPWGASRLNDMTWPYYIELQGKQSIRDDCDEWDNLYKASEDGFLVGQFYADFFGEGTCAPGEAAAGASTEWITGDLTTTYYLNSDPEISTLPITIKCYGWSRPGHTVNLETGGGTEPSDPNAENCHVSVRLYTKRGEDEYIRTITTLANEAETAHFPRTFKTTATGYYPVTLEAGSSDGLEVGDKITKVAMVFTNPNGSDATLNYPERVEIPEVGMHFYTYEDVWATTEIEPFETSWDFGGGLGNWYAEGDKSNDPLASYGWAYTNNAGWSSGLARCDLTLINSEVVGATCPSSFATGHTGFTYNMPAGVIAGESAKITAIVDLVYIYHYIIDGGASQVSIGFTDGTISTNWYDAGRPDAGSSQSFYGLSSIWDITLHPTFVGKEVSWIRIVGTGRGYAIRYHSVEITGFRFEESDENDIGQTLQATGIPVIYFSQKPYYTINTEVAAKWKLVGTQAYGGVVALARDAQNYICARMSTDTIAIVKARGGIETVLATTSHVHDYDNGEWIKLKIEDGHFTVRTRSNINADWSAIQLEYTWTEADGVLITEKDISHVGIYAFKDAPWFRITGFDPAQGSTLGILPPGEDFASLPSSGEIKIDDCTYTYSGKQEPAGTWGGPYQGRNVTDWGSYSNDGASYDGTAAEFIRFEYLTNSSHSNDFDSYLMAVETGFAWTIDEVDFKPFITTRGVRINLRNRGRFFGPQVSGDVVGMSTRVWLTAALTGLARTTGEDTTHSPGALAFLSSTTEVILLEFAASSGHGPLTDRDMINIVCQLSDANPMFPGDNEISSMTLSGTPQQVNP